MYNPVMVDGEGAFTILDGGTFGETVDCPFLAAGFGSRQVGSIAFIHKDHIRGIEGNGCIQMCGSIVKDMCELDHCGFS